MNNWKERIITYVESLDENITIDDAEQLIHNELARIKEVCSEEIPKPDMPNCKADHFAVRWENEKAGTHGYAPKCKNEWEKNICGKTQRIKGACKSCAYRQNQEITDAFVQRHFTGTGKNALVMGIYPLLEGDTCKFLAIDFDKRGWRDEILSAKSIFKEYGIERIMFL